eukprot:11208423-Lingulodinium_polyedra.AAC.1
MYWRGYIECVAGGGGTCKAIDMGCPNGVFMLNKSFGLREDWAQRWVYRRYVQRASFDGAAVALRAVEPDV